MSSSLLQHETGLAPSQSQSIDTRATTSTDRSSIMAAAAVEDRVKDLRSFASLNPEQRGQVLKIASGLDSSISVEQKVALIDTMLTKRLSNGNLMINDVSSGQTLLSHLAAFSDLHLHQKLQGKITPESLLTSHLMEICHEGLIDQKSSFRCTATSLQWSVARDNPAYLTQVLHDLAQNGEARSAHGSQNLRLRDFNPSGARNPASFIIQCALMDLGSDAGYDSNTDRVRGLQTSHTGLYSRQVEKMYESLTGQPFARVDNDRSDMLAKLGESLDKNQINMVCIAGLGTDGHALHAVTATKIEGGYVYYRNPWGTYHNADGMGGAELVSSKDGVYRLPIDAFEKKCAYVMVQGGQFGTTAGAEREDVQVVFFTEQVADIEELKPVSKDSGNAETQARPAELKSVETRQEPENQTEEFRDDGHAAAVASAAALIDRKRKELRSLKFDPAAEEI